VLGGLFLVISLGLALLSRTPGGSGVEEAGRSLSIEEGESWIEQEINPPPVEFDFNPEDLFIINEEPIETQ
jgi:preprotein translocase subunit SecG